MAIMVGINRVRGKEIQRYKEDAALDKVEWKFMIFAAEPELITFKAF